ncbi:MAG: hypothetical protein RML35_01165 [Chloroherpetonaceae bacterium]|nr:hypothetical protein [Chloroherpetonaceae bacterium]
MQLEDSKANFQTDLQVKRYSELIIYAIIFLFLVAASFVVSIVLSRQSQQDAQHIFCATQQQRSWANAVESFTRANIAIYMESGNAMPDLKTAVEAIQQFKHLMNALAHGDS